MRKLFLQIASWTLIFIALCLPAMAAPSGLNLIPTTDVLDKGVMSLETESDGNGQPWSGECDQLILLQVGIGKGIELGIDKCVNDPNSWVNFKWRVCNESGNLPAVALGTQGINNNEHPQPYLAITKSLRATRLHAGMVGIDHKTRYMLGVDHPVANWITFQADYTSGDENCSTYGIAINLNNSFSLTLARSIGNSSKVDNGHVINLAWSRALK